MEEKSDSDMTTVLGGEEIEVSHIAADALDEVALKRLEKFRPLLGTSERVKVRQVLVSDRRRYCFALLNQDEATAIDISCGKEPGWADTLTLESADAIAEEGLRLNLDFFSAWYQRQAKIKQVEQPEAIAQLQQRLAELQKTLSGSLSRGSASGSPPPTG